MPQTGTSNLGYQNKFTTTLTSGISSTDTTIGLNSLPTPSEGFLVLEPDSATAWEVIYYTSKTGSAVVCPSAGAGRGQDDSTPQSHSSGATVRMDTTAGMFEVLQNGSSLGTNSIAAANLAASAITLGYAQITSNSTTTSTTYAVGTSQLGVLVTLPAGGRRVEISVYTASLGSSAATVPTMGLFSGASVGTLTTQLTTFFGNASSSINNGAYMVWSGTPSAGSIAYTVGLLNSSGTTTLSANANYPAFILVKAI